MNYLLFFLLSFTLLFPSSIPLSATEALPGALIKCEDFSAVYYLAEDERRYVFPNEKIFYSWYEDFSDLVEVSCDELGDYELGERIPYQAGTRLVKVPSVTTVYAVEPEGVLRPINNEEQAETIYGDDWASRVDDLSEAFFPSYTVAEELEDDELPYGSILVDEDDTYYRFNADGSATELTSTFDAGRSLVLQSFAISLEEIEDYLGEDIDLVSLETEADEEVLSQALRTVIVYPDPEPVAVENYLMVFHACDEDREDCDEPRNHEVHLAQSDDGEEWSLVPSWETFDGSVPDVIRRDDTLYVYTASQELVRYDIGTTQQEDPVEVEVEGLDEGFVDPSLYLNEDGLFVLFFLYGQEGGDPAQCQDDEDECTKYIGSATEVEGSDGEEFELDDGYRAVVHITEDSSTQSVSDPDIFVDDEQYVLYISYGPSISAWISDELQGEYEEVDSLVSNGSGGIPSGYWDEDEGEYWTYTHLSTSGNPTTIRRAVHDDFETVSGSHWDTVISGESIGLGESYSVESPGFAVNE
ncbi:hypothetical protein HY733_02015 [Candidatus Uhrbacteria bacterium]|nr:hypothetical protein [Candidatus Uhrbacteria bacterium]